MAQRVKRLPAMREMGVQSLGREDPLKKEMAMFYIDLRNIFLDISL